MTRGCDVGVDLGDPALPVAGRGKLRGIRKSRNSRRRALVLLAVHALVAAHVAHFLVAKRTVSPVEPSEAMYTLELGQINAGFVFLLVALLGTLVFGRFFCGWGCHLVALQDFCGWLMKRAGVRPRPLRSRLLLWVPAAVAFYMFFWPSLRRIGIGWAGRWGWIETSATASFPGFTNHLTTDAFWATFPGPLFAVLTLATCGFAAVYLLGAKGFCTYGCPYGALFGGLDRLAVGSIVVSDACEQCGHCTATCTSNVLVHEEVRLYGRVVDPGCMKCMDCVSVCPKGALSFGFSMPSLFKKAPAGAERMRRYTLGAGQEVLLAAVCLCAVLAFRGLYDGPPLLMAVGLGGITAYLALKLFQVLREPTVRVQSLTLKAAGRVTRAGWPFAFLSLAWLAFGVHSAFVQTQRARGRAALERTEATQEDALSGAHGARSYSAAHDRALAAAHGNFSRADRWGLFDVLEIELGLAWTHLLRNEPEPAEQRLRAAVAMAPEQGKLHQYLADFLLSRGRSAAAIEVLEEKIESGGSTAVDHFHVAGLLVEAERGEDAVVHYRSAAALAPEAAETRYNLGGLLRRLGRNDEAIEQLRIAARLAPDDAATQIELGLAYRAAGQDGEALRSLRRAIELDPTSPESRLHLPEVMRQIEGAFP